MGMYDEVICEYPLPDDKEPLRRQFQTKNLHRLLDRYTITKQGRLIHHRVRYVAEETPAEGRFGFQMVPVEQKDIDMDFHGDIRLSGMKDNTPCDYVVRFTHGALEWIRPIENFTEEQLALTYSRSLENQ
jgi:hypothetical protein